MNRRAIEAVEIKRGPHDAFNAEIQAALDTTVWGGELQSYVRYLKRTSCRRIPASGSTFRAATRRS